MRICPQCGGGLKQGWGYEKSAYERGGNPLEVDEFRCTSCGQRYRHRYEERFSGDIESWSYWSDATDGWEFLRETEWPTYGEPGTPARSSADPPEPAPRKPAPRKPAPEPAPAPALEPALDEHSVVYLLHFNNQAVLEYDRETGLHYEIDRSDFPDEAKYWRGFYMPHYTGFLGVYATAKGPMIFVDLERRLAQRGLTRATVTQSGELRSFRLEHEGETLIELTYRPLPSGFDAWSQDESFIDFFIWLEENVDAPKWYSYYTVELGQDVTWRPPPPEPDPGPHFGEYALVWDRQSRDFPERFRVLRPGELAADFPDRAAWTGSVASAQLDELLLRLRERYPSPRFVALTTYGDDWASAKKEFLDIFATDDYRG